MRSKKRVLKKACAHKSVPSKNVSSHFKVVTLYKPFIMICGSHHLVQLSKAKLEQNYDLDSVMFVAPMGSTVPHDLFKDLKTNFKKLKAIVHYYGMTEVSQIAKEQ